MSIITFRFVRFVLKTSLQFDCIPIISLAPIESKAKVSIDEHV